MLKIFQYHFLAVFLNFVQNNLCFGTKIIRKIGIQPQVYYIKVRCKGVYITRTCYPDVGVSSEVKDNIKISFLCVYGLEFHLQARAK